jgi:cytidyltransferase-like protein
MVADLFHYGHSEYLRKISEFKNDGDKLYVGIHNDKTVQSYKRLPVLTMDERIKVISSCKYIDKVIPDAPIFISKEYIDLHKIDLVFIPDNRISNVLTVTNNSISTSFNPVKIAYEMGIVKEIPYTPEISTTDIIKKIKNRTEL